ncbi:hypothetical protein C8Q72DRAFT_777369, partial [Fomitopsis betulina]
SSFPTLEKHLHPLAIATNATQANNVCLDIVLLTLGHLFHIFSDPEYNMAIRDTIHKSLEKQWKQADQEVFILAVLFNLYLCWRCFNLENPWFTEVSLWMMVDKCFHHIMAPPDYHMHHAFTDYLTGLGMFSDEAMSLELLKKMAENKKMSVDLISVWRACWTSRKTMGANGMVALAMCILSIVPNSTTTEWLFSLMGAIHTDQHNRLNAKRVQKMAMVKGDINT